MLSLRTILTDLYLSPRKVPNLRKVAFQKAGSLKLVLKQFRRIKSELLNTEIILIIRKLNVSPTIDLKIRLFLGRDKNARFLTDTKALVLDQVYPKEVLANKAPREIPKIHSINLTMPSKELKWIKT